MSIEEIIKRLEKLETAARKIAEWDLGENQDAKAIREAIDLLKTNPDAQPNEPLTLEELREMNGQPVFLSFPPGGGEWVLVRIKGKGVQFVYKNGISAPCKLSVDIGIQIYRRPPKED